MQPYRVWYFDYLNLGAGAEIGIYSRPAVMPSDPNELDQYFVDLSLSMPMQLYLYNYDKTKDPEHILSWEPTEKQWWITGFNPEHMFNVDVHKQVMIGCVDFSQFTDENGDNEMYNALEEYLIDYPEKSRFVLLDDKNYYVWICWYEVNFNE